MSIKFCTSEAYIHHKSSRHRKLVCIYSQEPNLIISTLNNFIFQIYGLPVFVSVYTPLNSYIRNVLLESLNLLGAEKLHKLELRLFNNDEVLENFVLQINYETSRNIDELETEFMQCIHSLENRCKPLKKVSNDCRFKILLHTFDFSNELKSQVRFIVKFVSSLIRLLTFQDFLWVSDNHQSSLSEVKIVPIAMNSNENIIQLYIERLK